MDRQRRANRQSGARLAVVFLGALNIGCSTVKPVVDPTVVTAFDEFSYSGGRATQDFRFPIDIVKNAVGDGNCLVHFAPCLLA